MFEVCSNFDHSRHDQLRIVHFSLSTNPFLDHLDHSSIKETLLNVPAAKHDQTRHATTRYRLRLHRARSVVLTPEEMVEIRAAQRTFEGAYIRTSLGQFSFALVVLKIFTSEFYSIGKSSHPTLNAPSF